MMWAKYPKDFPGSLQSQYWGVYMFGGHKEGIGQTNDLFIIKPKQRINSDIIVQRKNSIDYKNDMVELAIDVVQLKPDGRPPVPRMMHSAIHFNEKYLCKLYLFY